MLTRNTPCCSTPAGSARGAPPATPPSGPGPAARELLPSTTPTSRNRWRSQIFFSRLLYHCVLLQACAIYCRHKAGSGWMKIPDTFFPDGECRVREHPDNPGVCRHLVPQGRPGHGLLLPGTQVSAQHQDLLLSTSMRGDTVFGYLLFILLHIFHIYSVCK